MTPALRFNARIAALLDMKPCDVRQAVEAERRRLGGLPGSPIMLGKVTAPHLSAYDPDEERP